MNTSDPNLLPDPSSLVSLKLRGKLSAETYDKLMQAQGYNSAVGMQLMTLTERLQDGIELINLERRGEITREEVDERATKQGFDSATITELYRLTEVIPSASDIIRYAVREVYTPEIAETFGQYNELPEVLNLARDDLKAAGLPETTFTKEWAAHWLLPSIMQGFEMVHRGVIPAKSSPTSPLSLERLMVALDIMPAWRDKLTNISYAPYTRVDVRRMHKIGVLNDEAVFTAYADIGFSPFAPDCMHETVVEAFTCAKCRHNSKAGHMLDFTIIYNAEPPQAEKTNEDEEKVKERDRTKSDILSGLSDGLLSESEASALLAQLGYDSTDVEYYISRVEYEQDKDELANSLRYLHDAYIKGVLNFSKITDELGKLNLPAKMTEYYQKVWDLERTARSNKPTKAELMTFLRKGIIDEMTWHDEMVGAGYPDRYIEWYRATV